MSRPERQGDVSAMGVAGRGFHANPPDGCSCRGDQAAGERSAGAERQASDWRNQVLAWIGQQLPDGGSSGCTSRGGGLGASYHLSAGFPCEELPHEQALFRPLIETVLHEKLGEEFDLAVRASLAAMINEALVETIGSYLWFPYAVEAGGERAASELAAVSRCSSDAIIGLSLEGAILHWNPAAEKLYGYPAREVVGQHVSLLFPPGEREALDDMLARVALGESMAMACARRVARGGKKVLVDSSASPIDLRGEIIGMTLVEQGICQRVEVANALRQAVAAAEEANRAKTEFLANVSHELRSPMNAIVGMTALSLEEELSPQLRDNLLTIRDGANQMLSVVNNLLDVAKLESGDLDIDEVPFSLRATLEQTITLACPGVSPSHLSLECCVDQDVPDRLLGDSQRLQQLLGNLLSNAIKFTENGEVAVRVERRGGDANHCSLRFSVVDTGIGISPEDQERVFAPFVQVDASSTRRFTGAGLGLTIATHLARRLGGNLELESTPGAGSEFSFTAQFRLAEPPARGGADLPSRLAGASVLVVEGDAHSRALLEQLLQSWEMRVEAVGSCREALDRLEQGEGDVELTLVDAQTAMVDGWDPASRMASGTGLPRSLLVMATPGDRQGWEERCRGVPPRRYVEKPLDESALREAILGTLIAGDAEVNANGKLPPTWASETVAPLDVLLVEDTVANRKVVELVLGKRGHRVTNAYNGREALELVQQQRFDVILMDVQMPVMDGFQASMAIRQWEKENGAPPTPIIAMTAHALRTDRDRCFAAGMSGYISKPMDIHLLAQTVENSAKNSSMASEGSNDSRDAGALQQGGASAGPVSSHGEGHENVDLDQACRRLRGDRLLLDELMKCYRDDHLGLLEQISESLESGDAKVAHRAAHNLKGLSSNFDAVRTPYFAQQVELACAAGDLDEARRNMPQLSEAARELAELLVPSDNSAE